MLVSGVKLPKPAFCALFGPKFVGLFSGPVPDPGGLVQPCHGMAALGISPPNMPS